MLRDVWISPKAITVAAALVAGPALSGHQQVAKIKTKQRRAR